MIEIRLASAAVASAAASTTLSLELVVLARVLAGCRGRRSESHQVEHPVDLTLISKCSAADVRPGRCEMASRRVSARSVLGDVRVAVAGRGARRNGHGGRR